MMQPHEFRWEESGPDGGQVLDLRIQQTGDGFQITNLKDNSQTYECETPEEASTAMQELFTQGSMS